MWILAVVFLAITSASAIHTTVVNKHLTHENAALKNQVQALKIKKSTLNQPQKELNGVEITNLSEAAQ